MKPACNVLLLITAVLCTLLTAGCATSDRLAHANALAATAAFTHEVIPATPFALTAYVRITNPDQPLHIYIEGDGLAWITRYQPSNDPTPVQATGLQLAAQDPSANVVYLARPCQYTPSTDNPVCNTAYWTNKRFSGEVISAMQQAISHLSHRLHQQPLHLIGYSGGAAVAILVAAGRNDIASIRTIAGNLDHVRVNALHQVSQMPESLNAIDVAARVASIPQIHFTGAKDTVVPPVIANAFVTATTSHCASVHLVPDASHETGWTAVWPDLLAIIPVCR